MHESTRQKLLDTPAIDVNIKPERVNINSDGQLIVDWLENGQVHETVYDANWYYHNSNFKKKTHRQV